MNQSSSVWKTFVDHIMTWETGYANPTAAQGMTSDPHDPAAKCVNPGQIHTNKGVTYCTFKAYAGALGITPVSYDRFLRLTKEDVSKFIYRYYQDIKGDKFSDKIGLSLAEAAWGSGPGNAAKHLQKALVKMGKKVTVDGAIGPATIAAANSVDQGRLYSLFWEIRTAFLRSLAGYSRYGKGWMNRVNSFLDKFPVTTMVIGVGVIAAGMLLAYHFLSTDKQVEKALQTVQI